MKRKTLAIGIVIGIILFSLGVYAAEFKTMYCSCNCQDEILPAKGFAKSVKEAENRCHDMCGRNCGVKADCDEDCESCCEEYCSSIDEGKEGCEEACQKSCEFKKMIGGIVDLIYIAAGIVAAIMLVVHGLRLISSQNPADREDAKKSIFFVIFALIIIGLAGVLVEEFAGRIKLAEGGEVIEQVEGCGGKILDVYHEISGDEITISVNFINNGDKKCHYKGLLYTLKGNRLEDEPDAGWFDVESGRIATIKLSSGGDMMWDAYALRGGYRVELKLGTPRKVVDEYIGELPSEFQCEWDFPDPKDKFDEPEFGFKNNQLYIPIKYDDKSEHTCQYRVHIYAKDGSPLKTSDWESHADWTFHRAVKEFKGGYVIKFEEKKAGEIPEAEKTYEFPEEYRCEKNGEMEVDWEIEGHNVKFRTTVKNNAKTKCEYDVSIQDSEGDEKEKVGFVVDAESEKTKNPFHRTWKFNRGEVVLVLTERVTGKEIEREEISILSDVGKNMLEEMEQTMISCWDDCHDTPEKEAKCRGDNFDTSILRDEEGREDHLWRKWIEDDLAEERPEVRDAFTYWKVDNPLNHDSEEFCIVFRDNGRIQGWRSSSQWCNLDVKENVCGTS